MRIANQSKNQMNMKLLCPICNEPSARIPNTRIRAEMSYILVPRECIMGHRFFSMEYVPEDQKQFEKYSYLLEKTGDSTEARREYMKYYMRQYRKQKEEEKEYEVNVLGFDISDNDPVRPLI